MWKQVAHSAETTKLHISQPCSIALQPTYLLVNSVSSCATDVQETKKKSSDKATLGP